MLKNSGNIEKTASSGEMSRRVMALALPAIASNITVPLLGLCDTAITGHLGSALYLAAIAAGGTMLNVIYWLCGFLRMGTTGLTAEAYGASDRSASATILGRSLLLAMIIGIAAAMLRHPLGELLLSIIAPDPEISLLASSYFRICILGAPALLITLSVNGWFIGMQNTALPMAISISVNVVNILCSLAAVFLLKLGFTGVAVGTLTANWVGAALALALLAVYCRRHGIRPAWRDIFRRGGLGRFFNVSGDLFLRSFCLMAVTMGMTSFSARIGAETLAVNTVAMQFFMFFSYFMDGFAFSGEALCGRYAGERNRQDFLSAVRHILTISGAIAIVFTVAYAFGSNGIASLLTDEDSVRAGIRALWPVLTLLPLISAGAFIFDGFYIGITATRRMFFTTLSAMLLFFGSMLLLSDAAVSDESANMHLWSAFLGYLLVRGAGLAAQLPAATQRIPWRKA